MEARGGIGFVHTRFGGGLRAVCLALLASAIACGGDRRAPEQPSALPAPEYVAPVVSGSAGSSATTAPSTPEPPPPPSDEARLEAVAKRLDALGQGFIGFWKAHGPDAEFGGFHGTLDRKGAPATPTDKGLIQQSRHLWTFSMWYARREAKPEIKAVADNVYRFLSDHFRDKDGEYFFKVSRQGAPIDRKKVLYAEAFAIYALSQYSQAFAAPEAAERALKCFRSLDRRAHDKKNGGYDQRKDAPWLTAGAAKETNTHLHLIEAFTLLYAVTKDPVVLLRVEELVTVFTDRIVQPGGFAQKDFLLDWKPFGPPVVSYGHDLETAWLLLETARVLGRPDDPKIVEAAKRIGMNSAERGFDSEKGGYFEEGVPDGSPNKLEKIWWIQAEAIPALVELFRLTRDKKLLDRLERTLDFVEGSQRDKEYGELYWGILPDGKVGPHGDHKGEEWKASYHDLRAVVFAGDFIRRK